ncbi:hypothetical protein TYRP_008322 [Tyrophagus putrescentiae]|nr:hypothetical protein TYRP_008322 [Tyrophagus putrescentiae]
MEIVCQWSDPRKEEDENDEKKKKHRNTGATCNPADVVRIEVPRARHKRREATKATCGLLVAQEN